MHCLIRLSYIFSGKPPWMIKTTHLRRELNLGVAVVRFNGDFIMHCTAFFLTCAHVHDVRFYHYIEMNNALVGSATSWVHH